ncbi:hypothetical protein BJF78_15375 [Pseudonocardia sp. CNS-139]|nr:hypothetical protein BJF78_15375 [Pseudonocardia sp. CNS-139]
MAEENGGMREPARLERNRQDRLVGGVCAGIARYFGIDPVVVRIAVVALTLVSGGAGALAYLVAWVLMPQASGAPEATHTRDDLPDARTAWGTVGRELRTLAADLRAPRPAEEPPPRPADQPGEPGRQGPVGSVDAAMTALGDRLRAPEVRAGAKRTATSLSTAVTATADQIGRGPAGPARAPAPPAAPRVTAAAPRAEQVPSGGRT